jgi:hypothetical protein
MRYKIIQWGLVTVGLFLLASPASFAQGCGAMITEEALQYEKDFHHVVPNARLNSQSYSFPVQFHVLTRSDGSGGAPWEFLQEQLDSLNLHFAPLNFSFYTCGPIDMIADDWFYLFKRTKGGEDSLCKSRDLGNAINMYISGDIIENPYTPNQSRDCGYAYVGAVRLGPNKNRIFISKSCLQNINTMTHEMGHYFNLYHTFESQTFGKELVNESNCSRTGDLVCDTPADPTGIYLDTACHYTGNLFHVIDDLGQFYTPMVTNFMSYYKTIRGDCRKNFSPGQLDRMAACQASNKLGFNCDGAVPVSITTMNLYPNPSFGSVTLVTESNSQFSIGATFALYNSLGQLVHNETIQVPSSKNIPLDHLAKGVYLTIVSYGKSKVRKLLVVQ